jgi:hypothetical protein
MYCKASTKARNLQFRTLRKVEDLRMHYTIVRSAAYCKYGAVAPH